MITPLVYEVHNDNYPTHMYINHALHMYMDDPVKQPIDKVTTDCVELYSIKWHIIKYVPIFILNLFKVSVSMTQSIGFNVMYKKRLDINRVIRMTALPRHMTKVIHNKLNAHVYKIRKDL